MDAQMLEGKVALITGASYGMGRTIAELFAEEGACVVLTARHVEQLNEVVEGIRAKGGKAVGVVADVCSTEDTKRVFKTASDFSPHLSEGLPASQRVRHPSFPRHLSGSTGITSAQPGPSFTFVAFAGFPRSVAFTFFGSSLPSRISFTPAIRIFPAAT